MPRSISIEGPEQNSLVVNDLAEADALPSQASSAMVLSHNGDAAEIEDAGGRRPSETRHGGL